MVIEDTLSFCHPPSALGFYVGLTQFIPVLVLTASFLTAWRTREIVFTLYFYYLTAVYFLLYVFQEAFRSPVPNPNCTDIWGSRYGMPATDAAVVFSYFTFVLGYHVVWQRTLTLRVLLFGLAFVIITPISLYVNMLNTVPQIFIGALVGTLSSVLFLAVTRTVFVPFVLDQVLLDPVGLGLLLGAHDSYLAVDPMLPPFRNGPGR